MKNKLPQQNASRESKPRCSMWKSAPKIWLAFLLIGLAALPGTWTEVTAAESQATAPARKKITGTVKASERPSLAPSSTKRMSHRTPW